MGNAYEHIAVVAKVQRAPSAQGKHLVLELLGATLQAHRAEFVECGMIRSENSQSLPSLLEI